ncbi:uncharacterized protein LOC106169826 [Lingula anatina]|uniref:Uncharacterized protein LOC106169826 n=1 Tax=Lingula anatina TaxID=7574 RepID=A0A1S3J3C9_LINAN|nr:uncharacterized protein LOC106169826 [Lingula anatina]|eukprot:XP_013404905.1 uncharacterized protein LOC106169826 [Lingula anatina]
MAARSRWNAVWIPIFFLSFHNSAVTCRKGEIYEHFLSSSARGEKFIHHDMFMISSPDILTGNTSAFIEYVFNGGEKRATAADGLEDFLRDFKELGNTSRTVNENMLLKTGKTNGRFSEEIPSRLDEGNLNETALWEHRGLAVDPSELQATVDGKDIKGSDTRSFKEEKPSKYSDFRKGNATSAMNLKSNITGDTENSQYNRVQMENNILFKIINRSGKRNQTGSSQKLYTLRFVETEGRKHGSHKRVGDVVMATATRGHGRRKRTPGRRCWMDCIWRWKYGFLKCGFYDKLTMCGGGDYMVRYYDVAKTYHAHCWPGKGTYGITRNRKFIWVYKCEGKFVVKYKKYLGCKPVCY